MTSHRGRRDAATRTAAPLATRTARLATRIAVLANRTAPLANRAAVLAGLAGLVLAAGCTGEPAATKSGDPSVPAGGLRLVAFNSCADALAGLKTAAKAHVGPWGLGDDHLRNVEDGGAVEGARPATRADAAGGARTAVEKAAPAGDGAPGFSGTNNHEAGADEPDLVKTDGRRIVTVAGGTLRVIDPATRRVTGRLDLAREAETAGGLAASLLLRGDRALILLPNEQFGIRTEIAVKPVRPGAAPPGVAAPDGVVGPRLILVDLAGPPRVLGEYRVDGSLVDARQVGATVRVVVRSGPRLAFPLDGRGGDAERIAANRRVIDEAGIEAWLPRYEVIAGGATTQGQVGCDRVTRPATYSGASLVTVLSFDLDAPAPGGAGPAGNASPAPTGTGPVPGGAGPAGSPLGDGDPVTVVTDGDTVYSNGSRLYIANDERWRLLPAMTDAGAAPRTEEQVTEIYQFDTSGPERPRYVTSASVPGWLINQYAMSEWGGHLRVATTSGRTWGDKPDSSSAVYVFRADGRTLTETGRVTGLGRGERIYAVRFVAGIGYVVTFRQTDPLYTLNLGDPAAPTVAGELKITGYSAYLHPVGDGRLLGVGQEASRQGQVQGTQVSLFDVADLARPTRLAQYHAPGGHSEAESDPHAFLYWPASGLAVVPLTRYGTAVTRGRPAAEPILGAVALRVDADSITEAGVIDHREMTGRAGPAPIRRTLVVDGVLWSVSDRAAKATDLTSMRTLGLVRFD